MTVIIIQPQATKAVPYSYPHVLILRQRLARQSRGYPLYNSGNNVRRREKELLVLYPHALRGPASAGVLNRRGECCYGDRFHL